MGIASMWIEGAVDVRGTSTLLEKTIQSSGVEAGIHIKHNDTAARIQLTETMMFMRPACLFG
ncbi:MAG TPA: hypothetical protein VF836_04655 [Gemmatimonadaceae bacterium]